ncbi:MAG: response regulator [Ignavibacteriaceae bacterium]|nr:response regulator [Ignavibacteriaceae bacterium]
MKESGNISLDEVINNFDGVFFWQDDLEAGVSNIQYSENVQGVTGFSGTEIKELKGGWFSLIPSEDRYKFKKSLDDLEKNPDKDSLQIKYRITTKDGRTISLLEKVNVQRNSDGKIIKKFGLVIDISEFVNKIEKLTKEKEELDQVNLSKDNFISILSHDLRSPFTSILGFAEILMNETSLSEKDKAEYLKYIYDSSQNQLQLINYMLDWSRLQTGRLKVEPQRIHAQSIAYNCVSYLTGLAIRKNININVDIPDTFYIEADERLITQVLTNLISNAVKFSRENDLVEVRASVYNEKFIEFVVKDNGVGISETNKAKLFNIGKLFTTEGTKGEKGSGLGLALAKQIVEKHGGEIWFYSDEGKGSEFHFTVPSATNTILLVIENRENLKTLENSMRENYPNFTIISAENAFEALGMISTKTPSLIILEHNLPLMNGLQFVNMVRKENKGMVIPFIAFLDSDSETTLKSYHEIDVRTIRQKPFFTDQLKEKIESLLY